jgi:hypothetical protein
MQTVTTIGLDIAKPVFQVHGIDAEGKVVIRRQLKRRYVLAFFQKLTNELIYLNKPGAGNLAGAAGVAADYAWPQRSNHRGDLQMIFLRNALDRLRRGQRMF